MEQMHRLPSHETDSHFPSRMVVYTGVFGDYDVLDPPEFPDVDHICFTNQSDFVATGWEIRYVSGLPEHLSNDSQIREARRLKLLPHLFLPDYQVWHWQDANL